ncbi:unnamed protein product [Eruca vesicaria subsp. sativa]|uniref:F-box domain-containing protein n=1 Tax=Eruca vesicaria subsp. sativa TaxID=29727 RepID=A0ABC8IWY3_ERUVS|nr:unnamed protein product [Eruca vesicaria subsp. sativa]
MDKISDLPDDLLLQILSLNPSKDVTATSFLSKTWSSLWTLVPVLGYDDRNHNGDYKLFTQFVYKSLLSNNAPVLQHLHLNLGPDCSSVDIGQWINHAVSRHLHELQIDIRSSNNGPFTLPSSLYTSATLQRLTLINCVFLDVPVHVHLPFLKTLSLKFVTYANKTSLPTFLTGCPNLEDLFVEHRFENSPMDVNVLVPSSQRLHMSISNYVGKYMLKYSSLKCLKFVGMASSKLLQIENMPELIKANVTFCEDTHKFLKALTSVRRLELRITLPEVVDLSSMIFHQLVHLILHKIAQEEWWSLSAM